ncbi:MAG: helix-turn-helix transcriptional regulator [Actinomycetes bacterium]
MPADLGPAAAEARPALPPARLRVAAALAAAGGAVPLAALARRVGGHPNATRAHLNALVAGGLAVAAPLPGAGRGRPPLGWKLTGPGRRALAGDLPLAAYTELATAMASELARSASGAERARALGRAWGKSRAPLPSAYAVTSILAELGFDPEVEGDVVRLRTCPILAAATAHPEIVCAIHAGMVEGASGRAGLRLVPFAEPGACRIQPADSRVSEPIKPTLP